MRVYVFTLAALFAVIIGMIQIRGYFAIGGEMIVPMAVFAYMMKKEMEEEND